MSVRNLDRLHNPQAVALIGATPRPGSLGAVLTGNLRQGGFTGKLLLVNPHHQSISDIPVCPDVASLPIAPDLAVIATPPDTVPGVVAELGAANVAQWCRRCIERAVAGRPSAGASLEREVAEERP